MPSCHSTNDICAGMVENESIENGGVVITDHQIRGRGQGSNTWRTEPGQNLTLSYFLDTSFLLANQQFYLNMVVSCAIADTIKFYLDSAVKVKWPNDIYYSDKKLCGILIQNSLRGNKIENSIIGIGINVNQENFEIENAISLQNVTGKSYKIQSIFEKLSEEIEKQYLRLKEHKFEEIKTIYLRNLRWFNENHTFSSAGNVFEGVINGIDDHGRLEINTVEGKRVFDFRHVSFIE